jgi:predicted dithiol-disulfide oxidoreductase (DUF899 family)
MSLPKVTSQAEWLEARRALLVEEKAFTRARDALSTKRRELPMVKVDKAYEFDGPLGTVELADLFGGSRQLIVQHFMFDPSWDDGCPSCSAAADEMSDGLLSHLHARSTTFAAVSRAPLARIDDYRSRRGWTFPWYSSAGSDFNYDFHVTIDESVAPMEINYRSRRELEAKGDSAVESPQPFELPGISCFLRDGDSVFHTNSTFARGTEMLGGAYTFLDLTALGRQEDWEEPRGRAGDAHRAIPDFSE